MVTNPKAKPECQTCKQWLSTLEPQGDRVTSELWAQGKSPYRNRSDK